MTEVLIDRTDTEQLMAVFERELRRLIHADPVPTVTYHLTRSQRGITKERSAQDMQFDRVMDLIRQVVES